MRLDELGEFGLLAELERRGLVQGSRTTPPQVDGLVVTQDALVEGVHFRFDLVSWHELGFRAAAANISDLAASGAEPLALIVSLGLPGDTRAEDVFELYEGLNEAGVPVRGGDTTRADSVLLSVTAIGRSERVPGRAGARPGDQLVVTGPLGAAGAAFRAGRSRGRRCASRRDAARAVATAMIDISDGLAADAAHIAHARDAGSRSSSSGCRSPTARRSTTSASARTTSCSRRRPTRSASGDRALRGGLRRRADPARRAGRARRLGALPLASLEVRERPEATTVPRGSPSAKSFTVGIERSRSAMRSPGVRRCSAAQTRPRLCELLEDRLERAGRVAPRGPEVDGDRRARDGLVERLSVELVHAASVAALQPSGQGGEAERRYFQTASRTIVRLIFESPAVRSTNRIGTSTTLNPLRSVR